MDTNSTNTTLLIRYLDEELEPGEKANLEAALRANAALQQELDNLQFARQAVSALGLRRQVAAFHTTFAREQQTPVVPLRATRRLSYYAMRVAAVALLAVTLTVFYQYFTFSTTSFYEDHYQGYSISTTRGSQNANPLEEDFRAGRYPAVLSSFAALPSPDASACFYAGMAALETGDYARAQGLLNSVAEKNKAFQTSFFTDETEYYLALCYIRLNQPEKALPLVEKIQANPAHLYHSAFSWWDTLRLRWLN